MPLDLDENHATYQIRSYKPGIIRINQQILYQSLIVSNHQLIENWSPQTFSELTAACLTPILTLQPDILLLGTGAVSHYLAAEIYGELINQGIGVEIMSTSAACRTYNALTAEERHVAAALIIK